MRVFLLLSSLMLGACGLRYPITNPPMPPGPESLPHPTIQSVVQSRLSTARAGTDTVTPLEVVSVGFCSLDARWTALPQDQQWFQVKVDGVIKDWPGFVVPTTQGCFQTPRAYNFPAGTHTVTVTLVYPPGYVDACAPGDPSCVSNGCTIGPECYGAPSDALAVLSTFGQQSLAGPPPPIQNGVVSR